ncbi:MAG: trypsin-like peptidase domain-containing protein [Clostridia bacterium]|nr:trypsin-like peptidase domain-containing protein [Clostridia bacterium]
MTLKKSIALLLTAVILASACGVWLGFYLNETVTATETASEGHLSIVQIAQSTLDTVVEITTETTVTDRRMRQYIYEGAGSGVVISSDGKIVTNNHVIEGAGKITVRLSNGEEYAATLLGRDAASDLAVLKINKTDLKYAVFGDSDTLQVGETAVAIGNPLGELGGTVTEGIISAKEPSCQSYIPLRIPMPNES